MKLKHDVIIGLRLILMAGRGAFEKTADRDAAEGGTRTTLTTDRPPYLSRPLLLPPNESVSNFTKKLSHGQTATKYVLANLSWKRLPDKHDRR